MNKTSARSNKWMKLYREYSNQLSQIESSLASVLKDVSLSNEAMLGKLEELIQTLPVEDELQQLIILPEKVFGFRSPVYNWAMPIGYELMQMFDKKRKSLERRKRKIEQGNTEEEDSIESENTSEIPLPEEVSNIILELLGGVEGDDGEYR